MYTVYSMCVYVYTCVCTYVMWQTKLGLYGGSGGPRTERVAGSVGGFGLIV